jgi:hypothetical protein
MDPQVFAAAKIADYERMSREWQLIGEALNADPRIERGLGFTQRVSLGWFTGWLIHPQGGYAPAV